MKSFTLLSALTAFTALPAAAHHEGSLSSFNQLIVAGVAITIACVVTGLSLKRKAVGN